MIAISISLLVIGCTNINQFAYQNAGNEIVAACIKEMIGTGDSAKMGFQISTNLFPSIGTVKEKMEWQHVYDSTKKSMLSIGAFIVVVDTLTHFKEDSISIKPNFADTAFTKIDTTKYAELKANKYFKKIDINFIANQIGVKVIDKPPGEKFGKIYYNSAFIAGFNFSNIEYDLIKNKAIVNGGVWRNGKSVFAYFMLLAKNNNKWQVVYFQKTGQS